MLQDTKNVRKTSQLNNRFELYAGFKFNSKKSNETHRYYNAVGSLLSIQDYNDETKIDLCYR